MGNILGFWSLDGVYDTRPDAIWWDAPFSEREKDFCSQINRADQESFKLYLKGVRVLRSPVMSYGTTYQSLRDSVLAKSFSLLHSVLGIKKHIWNISAVMHKHEE